MDGDGAKPGLEDGRHLTCSLTTGIIRRVRSVCGEDALPQLLAAAGSTRTLAYLEDISNWVSRDEAVALFDAAASLTGDDQIARHVGEDAVRQYAGTPVATVLRSLGSVEELLRQIATVTSKFSTLSVMEVVEVSPGRAVLSRRARDASYAHHWLCEWGLGLLSAAPMLYAVPPATVEELECQTWGAERCRISVTWDSALAARMSDPAEHLTALEAQIVALNQSFENMYAAAGDLIADDDLHSALEKITDRSATAARAPRYLLVVRPEPDAPLQIHHRGMSDAEAARLAEQVMSPEAEAIDDRWLLADIRSHRRHYGRIAAMFDERQSFFPQERRALAQYARYAANALDRAIALAEARRERAEAQRAHAETRALLDFARSLAGAPSEEVAKRLADALPRLVDCDRVTVSLCDPVSQRLECVAAHGYPPDLEAELLKLYIVRGETDPELGARLFEQDQPQALFFGQDSASPFIQEMFRTFGSAAIVLVPIMVRGEVLGAISVSVVEHPERLRETPDLQHRLCGIAAQAAVGLENGALIDRISHQARHDSLTSLANRSFFAERFEQALDAARAASTPLGLFYVDIDDFKLVNDQHGHAVGDELLCQIASRLLSTMRSEDTVARLGGDEFAIIVRDAASAADVEAAARRVAQIFDQPFEVDGGAINVGASVGSATWPHDADDLDHLMRHADASMYDAKWATKGQAAR